MKEEDFLNEFEDQKEKTWKSNYINYIILSNKITSISEKYNNNNYNIENKIENENENEDIDDNQNEKSQLELNVSKLDKITKVLIKEDKEQLKPIRNFSEPDADLEGDKIKEYNTEEEKRIKELKKPTKEFMSLVDKEIRTMHIFYINKETNLYNNINTLITLYKNPKNKENYGKKMEIIENLDYLGKLCYSLIKYVYLNIKALINILTLYDDKVMKMQYISFDYLKKHLSKKNGDLVYILNFKILDESINSIENLFGLIEKELNETYFKNNQKEKEKFYDYKEELDDNIQEIEKIRENIFKELKPWNKYLNISLRIPTSGYHSIFCNTSLIADSDPPPSVRKKKYKTVYKKSQIKIDNINQNEIKKKNTDYLTKEKRNDINNNTNNDSLIDNNNQNINKKKKKKNQIEINLENDNEYEIAKNFRDSDLFRQSEVFSYATEKVLNNNSIWNLRLLYILLFFYSFSISFIIPKIIKLIYTWDFTNTTLILYGIALSIPSLGNLFAKGILLCFAYKSFKLILKISLFLLLVYYNLFFLGLYFNNIILIITGRFLLGFSLLKHLSKIYVEKFVPLSNQIKINQKLALTLNIGFFVGLLSNSFDYFTDDISVGDINFLGFFTIGCFLILFVVFILVIFLFNEPTDNQLLTESLINLNMNHRLSKGFVDAKDQKLAEYHDRNYSKANEDALLSETNELSSFVQTQLKRKKGFYYKISFLLLFLLLSSEYMKENLLLLIPRIMVYKKNNYEKDILIFGPVVISCLFLFSYIIQKNILNKKSKTQRERYYIIIITFILFILNGLFVFLVFPNLFKKKYNEIIRKVYIPAIGIFCMILLNEIYYAMIINLFIKLLPSAKLKFCCLKTASMINLVTKITKIIPSLIIFFINFNNKDDFIQKIYEDNDDNFIDISNAILFGTQTLNFFICLILCLLSVSSLKISSKNRILYQE